MSEKDPNLVNSHNESAEGLKVAKLVRNLDDGEPSLAWRSRLNEKILAAGAKRRSQRVWAWIYGGTASASAAVCAVVLLATMLVPGNPVEVRPGARSVEAAMVIAHRENTHFADIAGPGLSVAEAAPKVEALRKGVQWNESDLEAL